MADNQNSRVMSPIAAAITGLIIGVAGTAAVALSDRENRRKAAKKATEMKQDLKKWSEKTLNDLQASRKSMRAKTDRTAEEILDEAEKKQDKGLDEKILHN